MRHASHAAQPGAGNKLMTAMRSKTAKTVGKALLRGAMFGSGLGLIVSAGHASAAGDHASGGALLAAGTNLVMTSFKKDVTHRFGTSAALTVAAATVGGVGGGLREPYTGMMTTAGYVYSMLATGFSVANLGMVFASHDKR